MSGILLQGVGQNLCYIVKQERVFVYTVETIKMGWNAAAPISVGKWLVPLTPLSVTGPQ